jgi:rhamnogalacturonan endolyase
LLPRRVMRVVLGCALFCACSGDDPSFMRDASAVQDDDDEGAERPEPGGDGDVPSLGGDAAVGRDARAPAAEPRDGAAAGGDGAQASDGARPVPSGDASQPVDPANPDGFYALERLDRGLIAVAQGGGVYLGWRLFGDEQVHGAALRFRVLRDGQAIAEVGDSTNYVDAMGSPGAKYEVRPLLGGSEGRPSEPALKLAQNFLRIPLEAPPAGTTPGAPTCEMPNERYTYAANDGSAADLDGDGRYELLLKWDPSNSKDNSQSGCTGPVFLDAYTLDGKRLWRVDLGPNIRAGAHYTQFIAYDFDGDGKAEVAVKTAPGTRDASGAFLSKGPAVDDDDRADFRSRNNAGGRTGYVLTGPEYLTVFDGATGKELSTVAFSPARGSVNAWGDDYGNRVDRFLAGAAHLEEGGGANLVMARGYYTRSALTAYRFRDGALSELWRFDSNQTPRSPDGKPFTGQGTHSLSVADVDDDPQQEIIYGAMTIDHDGRGMCSTGFGHGDALHVSDLVPSRPGLEVFMPHEDTSQPSYDLHDAKTCQVLVRGPVTGNDTGRGIAADVVANRPGAELWASGTSLLSSDGSNAGATPQSTNFLVYWDADPLRELLDKTVVQKYGGGNLLSCAECRSNNGTKSTPTLVADLFGDHREEVVLAESNNGALRIYTTTALSRTRLYTLMHDAQYRAAIAWQNVAYNQPPHPSFLLSTSTPPVPSFHYPPK